MRGGVEAGIEVIDDHLRDRTVAGQRIGDVILRIGDARLAQIARERPDHGDVAPAEPGLEHKLV